MGGGICVTLKRHQNMQMPLHIAEMACGPFRGRKIAPRSCDRLVIDLTSFGLITEAGESLAKPTYGFPCFLSIRATRHVTHPMYRNNMRPSSSRR